MATTPIRLSLLNGFELTIGSTALDLPLASQRVLAFIACQTKPIQRGFVAGNLWQDKADARAGANLRSALWRLGDVAHHLIESTGTALRIGREVTIDLRDATEIANHVIDGGELTVSPSSATRLCGADLLPDWYDDWLVMSREQFRQLRLHALEVLASRLLAHGDHPEAVRAALGAVAAEPLRESANRILVAAHLASGNASEAIRHFERYRCLLADEIGLQPSPAMTDLIEPVLSRSSVNP